MENNNERTVWVFAEEVDKWIEISFKALKHGNIFRIDDGETRYSNPDTGDNIWIAVGKPYKNDDGIWTIKTLY